jgi:FAD/FMN-containing dehydrogenase
MPNATSGRTRAAAVWHDPVMAEALARFRHIRPAAAAHCRSAADVASALARARTEGLPVAVRGGGHCFGGTSSTGGLLIDLAGIDGIRLEGDLAVIGGGATLGRIYDELELHGRTLNAGCGTTVGIGGLVLGGGLGILGRMYGTLSDRLRAAEVVLASGEIVRADEELLWALRGAGQARFAVVTELAFATVEPPPSTAFELLWAPDALPAVLHAWQRWAPEAPDAMAASLVVTAGDRLQVKVFGSMAGSEAETSRTLAALCDAAGAPPRAAVHHPGSFREVERFLSGPGEEGGQDEPMWCKSEYVRDALPDKAAEALVAHVHGRPDGIQAELDFSPWAGAYARTPAMATAFAHRGARFLLKHAVTVPAGADPARARDWLAASYAITHPHGTGGAYPNFPDTDLEPWDASYHLGNRDRLVELKRRYDPQGVFGPTP